MTQSLRVGVIGVGHLGRHHARIYSTLPCVTCVGVSDTDIARGQAIADEFNVVFFSNPDESYLKDTLFEEHTLCNSHINLGYEHYK